MFTDKKSIITKQMNEDIKKYEGIKFSIGLSIKFYHDELNGQNKEVHGQKHSDPIVVLNEDKVSNLYNDQVAYLDKWIETFTNTASGLEIERCDKLYLNVAKYEPIRGSSYIQLPKAIADKKAK